MSVKVNLKKVMADIESMFVKSGNSREKVFGGAKIYFYRIHTNNVRSTYSDEDLSHALPNPVIADCNGDFPSIFVNPDDGPYTIKLANRKDFIFLMGDYSVTNGE